MNELRKTRNLSVAEYFNRVQQEYLIAEFRRRIYSSSKDKAYYTKVMNYKQEKFIDISERNALKSIVNDKQTLKEVRSTLFDSHGVPLFEMSEVDLMNYYTVGVDFSYDGQVCTFLGLESEEAIINLGGKTKKVSKTEIFRIF